MHRARHLHGVVAQITMRKDLFWSSQDRKDVTTDTFSVLVYLHEETFNRLLLTKFKAEKTKPL